MTARPAPQARTGRRPSLRARAARIRLLVLDVDGVLTDGLIRFEPGGGETKTFHVRDGHGLVVAQRAGIGVALVSGRTSRAVDLRAKELGIRDVHQGCREKAATLARIRRKWKAGPEEVAVMGDDLVDLPLFREAGLALAVSDAPAEVRTRADWVSRSPGGRGAVREAVEMLLKARGSWEAIVRSEAEGKR